MFRFIKKNVRDLSFTYSYVFNKCKDEQSAVVDIVFNLKYGCGKGGDSFVILS